MKRRKILQRMTTVRVSDQLRQHIREAAFQQSQTESQFIRKALEQAVRHRSPYAWLEA